MFNLFVLEAARESTSEGILALPAIEDKHALGRSLGRQIYQCAVEGRQSGAAVKCKGQQVRVGYLRMAAQTFPGNVFAAGDLDTVRPEDMARQIRDPS